MNKFRAAVLAFLVAIAGLTLPSANAALITVACSGGGSFTVNDSTNTVTAGVSCAGTAIIPSGVTTIGSYAFRDAPITSVSFPQGLTTIGIQSFQRSSLVSVFIPKTVTSIGFLAFSIPTSSPSVNFETGGTSALTIGNTAFQYFKGACIVLPSTLTNLDPTAFEASNTLQNIYFSGDAPTVASNISVVSTPIVHHKTTATGFTNPWKGLVTQASTFTTPAFTLSNTNETATRSTAITGYSLNQTGGSVGCYSIFPAPANGLTFNTSTGVLAGSPTAYADPVTYTISGANGAGSASASFTVSVPAPPAIPAFTLTNSAETVTAGTAVTGYSISTTGGAVAGYSITPAARNGLSFNITTGLLSGTPSLSDTGTVYTITGTNVSGSASATYRVKVDASLAPPPAPPTIPDPPQSSTIEKISLTAGSASGGTKVMVAGSFSICRVANVSIDQANLPASLWSATSSEVIITMPPHIAGKVEITIWNGCVPVLPSITYLYVNGEDAKITQPSLVDTTTAQVPQTPVINPGIPIETSSVTSPTDIKVTSKGPLEKTLVLKIYFDLSSFKVKANNLFAIKELSSVIAGLGGKITVSITGFAQPTPGSEATDGVLSERRALAVAKLLRQNGVNTKVVYKGAGRAALNIPSSRYVEIIAANS